MGEDRMVEVTQRLYDTVATRTTWVTYEKET